MNFVLTGGNDFHQWLSYRGNGPYDPDTTVLDSTQRSALGWTTWINLYNKCYVYASKITLVLQNVSAFPPDEIEQPIARGYVNPSVNHHSMAMKFMVGQPYVRSFLCGPNTAGNSKQTIKWMMKTSTIFKEKTNLDNWVIGASNNNPAKEWFWNIRVENQDSDITTRPETRVFGQIWIKYYCRFYNRKWTVSPGGAVSSFPTYDTTSGTTLANDNPNLQYGPSSITENISGDGAPIL